MYKSYYALHGAFTRGLQERGGEKSTVVKGLIEELQIPVRRWQQQPVYKPCLFPRMAQLLLLDSRTSKLFPIHQQLSGPI